MSERWLLARRAYFVRDLVRDYCTVYLGIEEQNRLFTRDGLVSYAALRDLLGEVNRKGVFWRLKDTAHHLFRQMVEQPAEDAILLWQYAGSAAPSGVTVQTPVEALLDWCIGYAFHECAKLREDAFQRQHYSSRLAQLARTPSVTDDLYDPLRELSAQTTESSARELHRILRPGGWGILLSPVEPDYEHTYEDDTITDPDERTRIFGQYDHRRIYGADYADRLREAGFEAADIDYAAALGEEACRRYALPRDHIYVVYRH